MNPALSTLVARDVAHRFLGRVLQQEDSVYAGAQRGCARQVLRGG